MGQKCRKYAQARKNGIIVRPQKNEDPAKQNSKGLRNKCRKIKEMEKRSDIGSRAG